MKYEDIKAKFPDASSVGGEIVARVNGESVVVANFVNGSFSLTKRGEETPEQKAPKAPKVPRNKTIKEPTVPVDPVVDPVVDPAVDQTTPPENDE